MSVLPTPPVTSCLCRRCCRNRERAMFCGSLPLSVPGFVRSLFMGEREGGHLMAFALSFPRVDSAQPRERPTNPTYV